LLDVFKKKNISITDFCNETGIDRDKFYAWKAGRGNPKADDSEIIQKWIEKNADLINREYIGHDPEHSSNLNEPSPGYGMPNMRVEVDNLATIKNEESLHSLIKSNAVLVDTNRDLTDMLKKSIFNSDSHQHVSVTLEPLLHLLAEAGVGRFWKDYDAGRIELNKLLLSTSTVGAVSGKEFS